MVINGCGQSGHRTLKLTVSQESTDEVKQIFLMLVEIQKAKSCFNDFWVGEVKNKHYHFVRL